ncbi:MAG: hypothetical protein M3155_09725, partial [Actinomycetota bacterium]|nr:hypothetical protein [Actinomycetota bacterium]
LAAPAPAAAAPAASVSTPEACYSSRKPVDFAGAGFRANARFAATVDGRRVMAGRATRFGDVSGSFRAPVPTRAGPGERAFTLRVSDGVRAATTRFSSTVFGAGFSPTSGDPATLRVRFFAYDFGARRTIYLHYLRPDLTLQTTVTLGVTRGPCGTLASARLRIFPFRARPGNWRLQLDTSRDYQRLARPRVRLVVPILRAP